MFFLFISLLLIWKKITGGKDTNNLIPTKIQYFSFSRPYSPKEDELGLKKKKKKVVRRIFQFYQKNPFLLIMDTMQIWMLYRWWAVLMGGVIRKNKSFPTNRYAFPYLITISFEVPFFFSMNERHPILFFFFK